MKILILNGSARKKGNTRTALKQIEKGIDLNSNSVEFLDITDFKIAGCLGCDGCKRTGICVIKDDAVGLVEKIVEADMVIFGSPVYWWGISSQTKALIDRIYMKNSTLPQLKKKIGVVAVGADELSGEQYKLIKGQFDCICEYLGWEFAVYKPISAGLIGDVEKQVGLMRELKEIGQKL